VLWTVSALCVACTTAVVFHFVEPRNGIIEAIFVEFTCIFLLLPSHCSVDCEDVLISHTFGVFSSLPTGKFQGCVSVHVTAIS
jgi:hypothetical protein